MILNNVYNIQHSKTKHAIMLSDAFSTCYAECHYAECRYAECRGVIGLSVKFKLKFECLPNQYRKNEMAML